MRHQDQLLLKEFVEIHNSIHRLMSQLERTQRLKSLPDSVQFKDSRVANKARPLQALRDSDSPMAVEKTGSHWSFVTSHSQKHVDSFMEQFQLNMRTPRMQGSKKGKSAPIGFGLGRQEDSLDTECTEC